MFAVIQKPQESFVQGFLSSMDPVFAPKWSVHLFAPPHKNSSLFYNFFWTIVHNRMSSIYYIT